MNQNGIQKSDQVTHRKAGKRTQRNTEQREQTKKTELKWQTYHTNNYTKCKWSKYTNLKIGIGRADLENMAQEIYFKYKDIGRLKVKGWGKYITQTLTKGKQEWLH